MQPRLLKTQQAEYVEAKYDGKNSSGYRPVGDRVLILTDQAADKTQGGIILAETNVERMTLAAETGIIVALGPDAFVWNSDRTRKLEGEKPKAGDRAFIKRYAGQVLMGADGQLYRIIDDIEVGAIATEAFAEVEAEFEKSRVFDPDAVTAA